MKSSIKLAAIGGLLLAGCLAASDTWAHHRRHRHVHRHVFARGRFVVARPVVVAPVVIAGRPHGVIDFDVDPEETKVYVNSEMRGQVDDFDGAPGKLHLLPGTHRIKLVAPDGGTWSEKVRVIAGHEINIKLELEED